MAGMEPQEPYAKPQRELSIREQRFVRGIVDGKSQAQAARDAGYSPKAARQKGSELMHRDYIRERARALMVEEGLDLREGIRALRRTLNAQRMGLTRDGEVVPMGDDGTTQVKAVETWAKLWDLFPNQLDVKHDVTGQVVVLREQDVIEGDPFAAVVDGEARELDAGT